MAHKISREEAIEKYENEKRIQKLIKEGKPYKSNRAERKRKFRELKKMTFMDKLKARGGLKTEKKDKKDGKKKPEAKAGGKK